MLHVAWSPDPAVRVRPASVFAEIRESRSNRQSDRVFQAASLQPEFLHAIWQAARLHFTDGALSPTQHDMIAAQVAAVTHADYFLFRHTRRLEREGIRRLVVALGETGDDATLLRQQGQRYVEIAWALRSGHLDSACLTHAERKLLEFIGVLTVSPGEITDAWIEELRMVGWSDDQIAEAVYDGAIFNMIVRIVQAFGIRPIAGHAADDLPPGRETA